MGKKAEQRKSLCLMNLSCLPARSGFQEHFAQGGVGLHDLHQQHAQHGAADELTDTDGDAVGDAGQPQRSGGRRIGEHDGDLNADDDRIEEHGRQGRHDGQTLEADVPQFVSHNTGQQGGQGAKDNIHDGGAQQVCQEAAQHHAHDVLGTEHGQQAEGLGNTHLHRTVGERLQRHAEHHIESCDHSAAGQFADSEILIHNNTPADEF